MLECLNIPVPASTIDEALAVIQSYTLRLRSIRFETHIGVTAEERAVTQELIVDVDVSFRSAAVPRRDQINDDVDYARVVGYVVDEGTSRHYKLLETYAKGVLTRLLTELPALNVRVAVTKKHVPTIHAVQAAVVELVGSR